MARPWKSCSVCKKTIPVGGRYYTCSVSTCNRVRDTKVFCTMACWDAHVPVMGHRNAWANEHRAPSSLAVANARPPGRGTEPRRRVRSGGVPVTDARKQEVLIIASRLKDYIKGQSDLNTSADVLDVLSDHVRLLALEAIERAREDGRKTVKGRDFRRPGQ
ncbi:MAG: hypothetical protein VX265_15640 [Myxococcota bacterium]|nr:hypothetical protein [Myxococcota bacterium]